MSEPVTFTWATPEGKSFEVEPIRDIEQWTGREMRAIDRVCGGDSTRGMSDLAFLGLILAVSLARVVPGMTIDDADRLLTVGRIRDINRQLNERRTALAVAEAEPAPEPTGRVVEFTGEAALAPAVAEGAEVLSPTSDAGEGSSEQA